MINQGEIAHFLAGSFVFMFMLLAVGLFFQYATEILKAIFDEKKDESEEEKQVWEQYWETVMSDRNKVRARFEAKHHYEVHEE